MATRFMTFSIFAALIMWLLSFAYADEERRVATVDTVARHWVDVLVQELNEKPKVESLRDAAAVPATWQRQEAAASDAPATR